MASLSIGDALNEASAFLGREARLVLPVAFMFIALPSAVLQAVLPETRPNELPEPGLWIAVLPLAAAVGLVGSIALSFLALRPGASVGEALQRGLVRFLPVLGTVLLVVLAAFALFIPVALLIGMLALVTGIAALALLMPLLSLLPLIVLWVRLLVMNAVGAAEEGGPLAILKRSWSLTAGHFWPLFGFLVLSLIAALAISAAVGAVGGSIIILAAGQPTPNGLSFYLLIILSALVQTLVSAFLQIMIARIYAQLAPSDRSAVFS